MYLVYRYFCDVYCCIAVLVHSSLYVYAYIATAVYTCQ